MSNIFCSNLNRTYLWHKISDKRQNRHLTRQKDRFYTNHQEEVCQTQTLEVYRCDVIAQKDQWESRITRQINYWKVWTSENLSIVRCLFTFRNDFITNEGEVALLRKSARTLQVIVCSNSNVKQAYCDYIFMCLIFLQIKFETGLLECDLSNS